MSRVINPFAFSSAVNLGSRDFESTASEYFTRSSASTFQIGSADAWGSCWVKFESIGDNSIWGKWQSTGTREYILYVTSDSPRKIEFIVNNSISGTTAVKWGTAPSTATWYHVFWYIDSTNMGISVNGGTFVTASSPSGGTKSSTDSFEIGHHFGGTDKYFDGLLLNVAFGKPPSTPTWATLRDSLYNSGNALYWESITSTQKTDWGLTSGNGCWYPLNETTTGADAIDNVAGLNLTDVNTVGVSADVP